MASPACDILTGSTITFSTGFFAQIVSASWSGQSRPAIPTSHCGTATKATFIPGGICDPGSLEVELHFNPDTTPPTEAVAETLTFTFAGGATWAATGFMTDFAWRGELDGKMIATATIKFSGDITITPDT